MFSSPPHVAGMRSASRRVHTGKDDCKHTVKIYTHRRHSTTRCIREVADWTGSIFYFCVSKWKNPLQSFTWRFHSDVYSHFYLTCRIWVPHLSVCESQLFIPVSLMNECLYEGHGVRHKINLSLESNQILEHTNSRPSFFLRFSHTESRIQCFLPMNWYVFVL